MSDFVPKKRATRSGQLSKQEKKELSKQ